MKQLLLICAMVVLVGCGEKEPVQKEPELRSENIITPDEAANELFVEAVVLVNEAKAKEVSDVEVAIKNYEEAFAKLQKIISDYKKSALAVKLISGETLFDGESLEQLRKRPLQLLRGVAEAKLIAEKAKVEAKAAAEAKAKATAEAKAKAAAEAKAKAAAEAEAKAIDVKRQSAIVEAAIRKAAQKPTGELTNADWEKVTRLDLENNKLTEFSKDLGKLTQLTYLSLFNNQLTNVKGLEKLTQLEELWLLNNPALTQTQIDELKKALPNCRIFSNPTK